MIPEIHRGYGSEAPNRSDYIIEHFLCKVNRLGAFLYKTYKAFYHFQQYIKSRANQLRQKACHIKGAAAAPVCTQASAAGSDPGYTLSR